MTEDVSSPRRAIRVLVLTDIVDSTALVERLGDLAAAELFAEVDRLTRDLLRAHGGLEIDRTDGFLMAFERPVPAIRFALAVHEALDGLSAHGPMVTARAGLHMGEVVLRPNSPEDVALGAKPLEVEGLAKPFAARVMSVAGPGQTLLTQTAFEVARRGAVGDRTLEDVVWADHGAWWLKGVSEPVPLFEVTRGTPRPPTPSEKVRPGTTASRSFRSLSWAAIALVLLLVVGALAMRPSRSRIFTVDQAGLVFDDPALQAQLDRGWAALMRNDTSQARAELTPLLQVDPLPPEIPLVVFTMASPTVDRDRLGTHLARLLPEDLADVGGIPLCVQGWRADLEMLRQAQTAERVAAHVDRMRSRRERAQSWLAEHPEDVMVAACLGIMSTNDLDPFLSAMAATDPDGRTPFVAAGRAESLSALGRSDEALHVIGRAREHDPRSAALLGVEAKVLQHSGDSRGALERLDEFLALDPGNLEYRLVAAQAAISLGDDAALERHQTLLLSEEWPARTRREHAVTLATDLLREGRPGRALDVVATLENPGYATFVFAGASRIPGALSVDQRRRLLDLHERGAGDIEDLAVRTQLTERRAQAALELVLATEGPGPRAEAIANDPGRADDRLGKVYDAWTGDPEPWLALLDHELAVVDGAMEGSGKSLAVSSFRCTAEAQRAVAYEVAGDPNRAAAHHRAALDEAGCANPNFRMIPAVSAAWLAREAHDRGAKEEAAIYLARFRDLWPHAELEVPVVVALVEVGLLGT
jgi:class 3 adenylate cyclase/tetratricopeptide (TPR) repeat protein